MNSEKSCKDSKKKKKKHKPFYNFWYDFVKVTGAIPTLLWLRLKIYRPTGARLPKGKVLISANHRSPMDPVSMFLSFPTRRLHCLATTNLFDTKIKRYFFTQMHCIETNKENFTMFAFHDVVTRLECGHAVLIFPEGKLNTDKEDNLLTFKSGIALMAHKAAAPIMPVYIVKKEKWYHRQRVVIGDPIYPDSLSKMPTMQELTALTDTIREKELELRRYFESLPEYKRLCPTHEDNSKTRNESEMKI